MILYTLYFILGLCVGSFLNAVIWRLEKGESVIAEPRGTMRGTARKMTRSYCPHCKHALAWHDLIPVLSFIWLRGKCGYCSKKISWQYPLVEIATGVIFVLIVVYFGNLFENWKLEVGIFFSITYRFYIASALIVIFVYDLRHYIIPDKVLFPAVGISFLYLLFQVFNNLSIQNLLLNCCAITGNEIAGLKILNLKLEISDQFVLYFLAAAGACLFFFLLVFMSKGRAMGMGDVKLAFLMGLILGWPNILVALFLAFMFGALVGLALIFSGRKKLKSQVPFGPFLIAGTFIALFWGQQIINWYWRFLL